MKKLQIFFWILLIGYAGCGCFQAHAQIADPVQDYLQMAVPDRHEFLDAYKVIYKATCDINGDGKNEIFVGTPYDYSGSKLIYWAAYAPITPTGYTRITPETSDVPLNLQTAFVGIVQEQQSKQGVLEVADSLMGGDNGHSVVGFSTVNFYSISNGQLVKSQLAALNLQSAPDKVFYNKYFGNQRQSREVKIETFTADQLAQQGYTVPTWSPPPPP